MLAPLIIVIPIFSLILAGYLCRKTVMGPHASRELNRFVVYLALPALLFKVMAHASWDVLYQPGFIGAFSLGCLVVFLLTLLLRTRLAKQPLADASLDGLNAAYANTAFIGIPLCLAALGPASQPLATIASILTVCVLFGFAIVLIELGLQTEKQPLQLVMKVGKSLAKNPLLVAPILGVLFAASKLHLPHSADVFLNLLGGAASPCALVALGLFLAEDRTTAEGQVSYANTLLISLLVFLKLCIQPAVTWVFAFLVFKLDPFIAKTAVLLSALPTGTGSFMLAEFYQREASTVSKAILISTLISMATVPVLLFYLGT